MLIQCCAISCVYNLRSFSNRETLVFSVNLAGGGVCPCSVILMGSFHAFLQIAVSNG